MRTMSLSLVCVFVLSFTTTAGAQQIECRGSAPLVKAVTLPDNHYVTTRSQFDTPNLQPLLTTSIFVNGPGTSCVIAHFSAHARITDNYIVFQVRIDGEPMQGISARSARTRRLPSSRCTATRRNSSAIPRSQRPTTPSHAMRRGTHTVQVMVAAGSGIDPNNLPQVGSPVLTLEHR